jgi:hypothetical protein
VYWYKFASTFFTNIETNFKSRPRNDETPHE